jgi:HK97 family phage portal protein
MKFPGTNIEDPATTGRSFEDISKGLDLCLKTQSPDVAAFLTGTDVGQDGGNGAKLTAPYVESAWVFIAISRIAEKISSIPFRISRMDEAKAKRVRAVRGSANARQRGFVRKALDESVIESGDIVDLFNRPHPTMSRQLFWESVVTWHCLRGEFFILPLDAGDLPVDLSTSAPRVQRLITLPTEMFWHIVHGNDLTGWRYTGSPLLSPIPSEMLLPSEVIHGRTFNLYLYWRGMSRLLVAMGAAGADFAASRYAQGYWMNNADTGAIVTTDQWLSDVQRATILTALRERKRKAGTADRPLILGGGLKVEKPVLSGMESQFIENRKMNRQEIGAIYGVPEAVMGFNDSKSSALSGGGNAIGQEMIGFIENTIAPLCRHLEAAFEPVVKTFGDGLCAWFDEESLPGMQDARRARMDTGLKAFGIGFTRNEINGVYDLGFPEDPTGDTRYLPFNLQEVGANEPLPGEGAPGAPASGTAEAEKSNPFARLGNLLGNIQQPTSNNQQRKPDTKTGCPHCHFEFDSAAQPEIAMGAVACPQCGETVYQTDTLKRELQRKANATLLWKAHVQSRRRAVKLMAGKVHNVLHKYRGRTLNKLDVVHLEKASLINPPSTLQLSTLPPPAVQRSLVDLIFDRHAFGNDLVLQLTNPISATLQLAGNELNSEIGLDDPWKMPPKKALEFLAGRTQEIQGVGGTVRDQLNTTLEEGIAKGETTQQLADRVRGVFKDLDYGEAQRIAQTETNMAYNSARHDSMLDAGIEYKAWLSSHGPNVRPAHALAEDDYSEGGDPGPIPIDEPFLVDGEELMYPGDPSGSAGNVINCQCISLAVQKLVEEESFTTFKIFGLGEMKFQKTSNIQHPTSNIQ